MLSIGAFSFDAESEELIAPDGTDVPLRPQTARVLGILAEHNGELVTKDTLMNAVWADTYVTDDSLVQCVSEIRRALGPDEAKLLATVPRHGYRLNAGRRPETCQEVTSDRGPKVYRALRSMSRRVWAISATVATLGMAFGIATLLPSQDVIPPEPVTIAVLPFENLSDDPEQDYLSSGLAEDLLTDLSRIGAVKVLSRNTTFGLRNTAATIPATIERFGATHLVDGSVRREHGMIRISVQLVQLSSGTNVWAQRYDRKLGDLFDIQDDVRTRIVEALSLKLAPQERERLLKAGTDAVSAYDLLLRGRYYETSLDRAGVTRAITFYRRALDVDPGFTEAYSRLANMYDFSSRFGWGEGFEADRALALEMAERAVRLDPENPFAHWTLGRVLSRLGRTQDSRARAIGELQAAIAIDPNYADAYGFVSLVYVGGAEQEKARKSIDKAFALNETPPSWYFQNRGIVSYFEGAFANAVEDLSLAIEMNPTAAFAHLWLAASYAMKGDQVSAEWEIVEAQALGEPLTVSDVLAVNRIIQHPAYREAYARGLAEAGLPE